VEEALVRPGFAQVLPPLISGQPDPLLEGPLLSPAHDRYEQIFLSFRHSPRLISSSDFWVKHDKYEVEERSEGSPTPMPAREKRIWPPAPSKMNGRTRRELRHRFGGRLRIELRARSNFMRRWGSDL
jgi:hypothetical protein